MLMSEEENSFSYDRLLLLTSCCSLASLMSLMRKQFVQADFLKHQDVVST